ncbi:MAG: hypothetical protein RL670_1290 [Actinomycetota bacterium]|jgi:pilus assembly protein CpaB
MKSKQLTLLLALLLAIVAGGAVYAFTTSVDARSVASKEPVTVLVAALQIPAGVSLSNAQAEGMVKSEVFPAATLPADAIKAVDANNRDLLVTAPIQPGSLIRSSNLAASLGTTSALAIPKGMVALAVELKEAQRVGSFVVAGSKIALLDNFTSGKGATQTRVLVPSVLVLAVGSTASSNGGAAGNANLVTVAVTPKDAARIVQAQSGGELTAVLVGDTLPTGADDTSDSRLFGGTQ